MYFIVLDYDPNGLSVLLVYFSSRQQLIRFFLLYHSYNKILNVESIYERPKEWELIPEYWQNICLWVSVSVPLQITLGVLFIIVQVSSLLGYFGKFNYFVLPKEFSHILCAHNLFLPAWYIDSYLYWDLKLVSSP